jgi:hypothetical protein
MWKIQILLHRHRKWEFRSPHLMKCLQVHMYHSKYRDSAVQLHQYTVHLLPMPMLLGVGFPMHRDLNVVYCTSRIEFQISRHTLPALVLCSPHLPENSGTYYLAPSISGRWYQAPHLLEKLDALFGREIADNFAQRPPWGLRFFNVQ